MIYEKISPTAETIAFIRRGLGIPYADDIALLCSAEKATRDFYHRSDFDIDLERMKKLSHWTKLRLYSVIAAIRQSGIQNILEIAAGFSPTGLIISEDSRVTYLETDLPGVVNQKEVIANSITNGRKNLKFFSTNALNINQLKVAVKEIQGGPIVIMHEGLWQYLTHEEKFIATTNINELLKYRGGVWITPDIVLRSHLESAFDNNAYLKRVRSVLTENTDRDMVKIAFESYDEAEDLIRSGGFSVEKHTQLELLPDLISSSDITIHKNIQHQQLWIMRCR